MFTQLILVTPELAQQLLSVNTINRKVRPGRVDYFIKFLKNGGWRETHQGICISDTGVLLDGQHRLLAIVKSGVSALLNVTTGAPRSSFDVIDDVAPRSLRDRSKEEKGVLEILRLANYFRTGYPVISIDDYEQYKTSIFYDRILELIKFAGTSLRKITVASVRLSAVIRSFDDKDYVFQQYRALSLSDFDSMSVRSKSLVKRLNEGKITTLSGDQSRAVLGVLIGNQLFDPSKRNLALAIPSIDAREGLRKEITDKLSRIVSV